MNTSCPLVWDLVTIDFGRYIEATSIALRFVTIGTLLFLLLCSATEGFEALPPFLQPTSCSIITTLPGLLLAVTGRFLGLSVEGEFWGFIFFRGGSVSSPGVSISEIIVRLKSFSKPTLTGYHCKRRRWWGLGGLINLVILAKSDTLSSTLLSFQPPPPTSPLPSSPSLLSLPYQRSSVPAVSSISSLYPSKSTSFFQ